MKIIKMMCLVFIIILTLSGCDNSSSDSSDKNAPRITDVEIVRWNGFQWVVTSAVYAYDWVNYRVHVWDRNMDIRKLYLLLYYPENSVVPYFDPDTFFYSTISAPETVLILSDPVQIMSVPTGTWRLEIQVEDAQGNLSNIWDEYVDLYY